MTLDGKSAIVTGGGSGLGRAGALALARAGAAVLVSDIDALAARATVDAIAQEGGRAWAFAADAGNAADAERMVGAAVDAFGALHILYNNAGIAVPFQMASRRGDRTVGLDRHHPHQPSTSSTAPITHPRDCQAGGGDINRFLDAHLPLVGLDGYAASKAASRSHQSMRLLRHEHRSTPSPG